MEHPRVAVVGAGYWGINYVRIFQAEQRLAAVCDTDGQTLSRAESMAPGVELSTSYDEVLDSDVDAVVIATPAATHADFALRALASGKHVLVEKPIALNVHSAERVAVAAEQAGRTVMVGHILLYHPTVEHLAKLIERGDLGEIYYLYATRVNLGRLRRDENALWSFGPHDVSVVLRLLRARPVRVSATGYGFLQRDVEDIVFLTVEFAGGQIAHIHLSWLDPRKERRLTVVGSRKMAVFDDTSADKLTVHDKGYDRPPSFTDFADYLTIRHGDTYIPHVAMKEPLAVACRHFLERIVTGRRPRTDVGSAVRVVAVLEAAHRSLARGGEPVTVPLTSADRNST